MKEILENPQFKPEDLVDYLKKHYSLKAEYEAWLDPMKNYTLETHTVAVMYEFEKYFGKRELPEKKNRGFFRLLLALHDVGKPRAIKEGDKRLQHQHTLEILHGLRDDLCLPEADIRLLFALINGDPVGSYLKEIMTLEDSRDQILKNAQRSTRKNDLFFDLLLIYYQVDVCAYTSSAGILSPLDHLFVWKPGTSEILLDEERKHLKFAAPIEKKLQLLERAVKDSTLS